VVSFFCVVGVWGFVFRFRALCYHAPPPAGGLDEYLSRLRLDDLRRVAGELSRRVEVWSVRVVAPVVEEAAGVFGVKPARFVEEFYEEAVRVAGYVAFPLGGLDAALLVDLMESFEGAYFSVEYREDRVGEIVRALREVPERAGWVAGSRFAVSFGRPPVTPYFPVTRSGGEGLTASLLYASHVRGEVSRGAALPEALRGAALEAYRLAYEALDASGSQVPLIGLDLSLSPWGEDSVAMLVEELLGMPLMSPGTLSLVRAINEALSALAGSLKAVGFNEVMLPVAEDERLKELVRLGQLRFRDLVSLTPLCVAGLDMVLIPSTVDDRVLRGVMRDLYSLHLLKGRTMGMRVILVGAEPGEDVELGEFGKTPVMDPLQ